MAVGIVVIALVCVVVKINFGSRKSTDNKKSEQKAQLHDSITGYTEQYFEDGILYVDDNYMRFCSNAANEDGLICARPNCKHQKSRTEECGAYVDNINTTGFAKRGDKIYYIGAGDTGDDDDIEGTSVAEYHTDTDVYTSFNVRNIGETPFVGESTFSIRNSSNQLPKIRESLDESCKEVYRVDYYRDGPPIYHYGYTSNRLVTGYCTEDSEVKVFVDNPEYVPDENGQYPRVAPYKKLGTYKNGQLINIGSEYSGKVSYTVKTKGRSTIKTGVIDVNCPADDEAMSWFQWRTPSKEQSVTITLKSNNSNLLLVDEEGNLCETLVIEADISKVEEITPPDPKVSDKRPSWQKVYSMSAVQDKISKYVSADDSTEELSWYTWTCAANWSQDEDTENRSYVIITGGPLYNNDDYPYVGSVFEREELPVTIWRWCALVLVAIISEFYRK